MKRGLRIKSRGQALIEFTLMVPVIIIILAGLTDLGLAFFVGMATQNAVREGARLRTQNIPSATVKDEVLDRMPAISQFTSGTDPTVAFGTNDIQVDGPTDTSVNCNDLSGTSVTQQIVSVTATGTYHFAFLKYIGFDTMTVSRTGTMRYEPTSICF